MSQAEMAPVSSAQVFGNHTQAQRMLLALGVVTVMEAVPMHFLLRAWRPWVAWVVLGLTLYSLWYLVAVARALAARPHVLSTDRLLLRVGSFYTVDIERVGIAHAEQVLSPPESAVSLKFISKPNVSLELSTPVCVHGPFGRTQLTTTIAFFTERADELIRELTQSPMRVASQSNSSNAGASASIQATSDTKYG